MDMEFLFHLPRTLGSDDYNDVRLAGHGTLHGFRNFVNPFLEVSDTQGSVVHVAYTRSLV